jgi:hypothetical protein
MSARRRLPRPTRMRVLVVLLPVAAFTLSLTAALGRDSVDVDETAFPWSSVGKIYNSARSSCSGALIARDKVLTAAHCLFNRATHRGAFCKWRSPGSCSSCMWSKRLDCSHSDRQLIYQKRFKQDGTLGNETRDKACAAYKGSE